MWSNQDTRDGVPLRIYKIVNARNSMQPHNNYTIMKGDEVQGLPELITWHLV